LKDRAGEESWNVVEMIESLGVRLKKDAIIKG